MKRILIAVLLLCIIILSCQSESITVKPTYLLKERNHISMIKRKYYSEDFYIDTKYVIETNCSKSHICIKYIGIESISSNKKIGKTLPEEQYMYDYLLSNTIDIIIDDSFQITSTNINMLIDTFKEKLDNCDIDFAVSKESIYHLLLTTYEELVSNLFLRNAFGKTLSIGENNFSKNVDGGIFEERIQLTKNMNYNISCKGMLKNINNVALTEYQQDLILNELQEIIEYSYVFTYANSSYRTKIEIFFNIIK